jgi:hypothetical protein
VIPRAYPQLPVRAKLAVAPYVLLALLVAFKLDDWGVIDLPAGPPPTTAHGSPAAAPSRAARADIPAAYLAAYRRAARSCPGLGWAVLAAVGKVESDHGRTRLPGVRSRANWAGAAGPMQLGIGGKAGPTWQHYAVDGDHDGRLSVYDVDDATATAARKLCHDGARTGRLTTALWAYNHSSSYVALVLAIARRYQAGGR